MVKHRATNEALSKAYSKLPDTDPTKIHCHGRDERRTDRYTRVMSWVGLNMLAYIPTLVFLLPKWRGKGIGIGVGQAQRSFAYARSRPEHSGYGAK